MSIVMILLPLSVFIAALFLVGYLWSVKDGQYDDLETPRSRMLWDDDLKTKQRREP